MDASDYSYLAFLMVEFEYGVYTEREIDDIMETILSIIE